MILGLTYSLGEKVVMTLAGSSSLIPVARVRTDDSKVAFTFNVTSDSQQLKEIIETLNERKVKATFFITEEIIFSNADLIKSLNDSNHQVALLIAFDEAQQSLKYEEIVTRIEGVISLLQTNHKIDLDVLRPYPVYNDNLILACNDLGLKPIMWDIDSNDEKNISINDVVQRVNLSWGNGSIILFSGNGDFTSQAIGILIDNFLESGVEIVRLDELLYQEKYYINNLGEQIRKR